MWDINQAELKREKQNAEIDQRKESRNVDGQFSTPNSFARAIVRQTLPMLDGCKDSILALEPACGSGSFVSALLHEFDGKIKVMGIDKDSDYLDVAMDCFGEAADFQLNDYLAWKPLEKYDLLTTNPPYVRHHYLSKELKSSFAAECRKKGLKFSGLSDLFCYFIIKGMDDLKEGGVAAWLIPEEFLSVNYGVNIKHYLLQHYSIPRIHVFAAEDTKFSDALVSSCVLWIKKTKSDINTGTLFSYGPDIEAPETQVKISKQALLENKKWGQKTMQQGPIQFKDLFVIKRGIATGSNAFFIIDDSTAKARRIPVQFLTPILPSARYVKVDHIIPDQSGNPANTEFRWLIDCREPEKDIPSKYPDLWAYLESGKTLKEESYICKNRAVWYWQDKREAPLFFLTYMGRGEKGKSPFRFILNKSRAIANNSFLLLYPTQRLREAMARNEITSQSLLNVLSSIEPSVLENGGRKYGGGLKKIEPKELGEVFLNLQLD